MTTHAETHAGRISRREESEAALRPPRPTFADAYRHANRSPLEIAAEGLTPTVIASVLASAGLDPAAGLRGVPKSREGYVCGLLTVSYRAAI